MKLKYIRYFGRFYSYQGKVGWLPFYQALVVMIMGRPDGMEWVKQSKINFVPTQKTT